MVRIQYRVSKQQPWSQETIPHSPPGNNVDPFGTAPLRVDENVLRLLQYYQFVFHTRMWCRHHHRHDSSKQISCCLDVHDFLHDCLNKPVTMYSTLACLVAHRVQSDLPPTDELSSFLLQKAVVALRLELNKSVLVAEINFLIWDICLMWFVESSRMNIDACVTHIKGAYALTEMVQGRTKTHLKSLVDKLAVRTTWMMVQTSQPGPLTNMCCADLPRLHRETDTDNFLLSRRFQAIIDEDFRATIRLLRHFTALFESNHVENPDSHTNILSQFHTENAEIDRRLYSLSVADMRAEALLTAIKIWKDYVFPRQGCRFIGALTQTIDLAARLRDMSTDMWKDHLDCLMWICTVGAMGIGHINAATFKVRTTNMTSDEAHHFFLQKIGSIIQSDESRVFYDMDVVGLDENSLAAFSKHFPYLDAAQSRIMHLMSINVLGLMNKDKDESGQLQ